MAIVAVTSAYHSNSQYKGNIMKRESIEDHVIYIALYENFTWVQF